MADLLSACNGDRIPQGNSVHVLDIGVGANCIYPIIGHISYGWKFVGTDIDPVSVSSAKLIAEANRNLTKAIDIRLQKSAENIFKGIIKPTDRFDLTLCNPPFHASQEEADAVGMKKLRNLGKLEDGAKPVLNFGGKTTELWCDGGEERFVRQMAEESVAFGQQCFWFTTLVSKKTTLRCCHMPYAMPVPRRSKLLIWLRAKRPVGLWPGPSLTDNSRKSGCVPAG
ncbi:Ribosomal RNA large subunit methyltransferase F [Budvicia aquatica]|uniref:Ribosomal RNA large subunit methyltransferase F n=1 Tax=Budvicia aquatica TaxID=82979 RepID=A0A484ZDP1_9GAMM|nr:Ribosomal RNA large subunit methyltransferase F [Budvicia aquatica]